MTNLYFFSLVFEKTEKTGSRLAEKTGSEKTGSGKNGVASCNREKTGSRLAIEHFSVITPSSLDKSFHVNHDQ